MTVTVTVMSYGDVMERLRSGPWMLASGCRWPARRRNGSREPAETSSAMGTTYRSRARGSVSRSEWSGRAVVGLPTLSHSSG